MAADQALVERLQAAAAVAILELANGGEVVAGTVWTQRRASVGRRD